jgi:lipopolysaccharide/colanic/teichoic acid biosynthesis glycosyltransferase
MTGAFKTRGRGRGSIGLSVGVDPSGSSKRGRFAPERDRISAPRTSSLSAEALEQIERLVPPFHEMRVPAVAVSPWRLPPRPVSRESLGEEGFDVLVTTIEPSSADRTAARPPAMVITVDRDGSGWPSPTMTKLRAACDRAVASVMLGQTIVLGTPVYVGATRDLLITPLEQRGLIVGRDVHVAFWPTRTRSARSRTRPTLVGGATVECALAAVQSLATNGPAEVVSSPEMAEASAIASFPRSRVGAWMKRVGDVAVATLGLVLLLPVLGAVAAAIYLDDGGAALFTQERIGLNGRSFRIRKFRTMVPDAEDRLGEVAELNGIRGPAFQIDGDPRLTRIGGFLRRTSLDELPQLWNVLRGDMSLVGPRPAPLVEVLAYEPWHRTRLTMRPGITGLAQVRARSYVDFDEKASLDLDYIVRWSPLLDIQILLRTIPVVFRLSGR